MAGLSEPAYHRLTYELTIAAAEALVAVNPGITFCYVSGEGRQHRAGAVEAQVTVGRSAELLKESKRGRALW